MPKAYVHITGIIFQCQDSDKTTMEDNNSSDYIQWRMNKLVIYLEFGQNIRFKLNRKEATEPK